MSKTTLSPTAANAEAMTALKRGDAAEARRLLETAMAEHGATAALWIGLAVACHALKDQVGLERALDSALALDHGNLRALLMKGDLLAQRRDRRGALAFYAAAVARAEALRPLPPIYAAEVQRVSAASQRLTAELSAQTIEDMRAAGYDEATASPRFAQALAMLTGSKQRYEQEPRSFFMPELPTVQFYPREAFPWLAAIEAATDDIRAELAGLLDDPAAWAPYIETSTERPTDRSKPLLDNPDWSACYLWKNGAPVPQIAARCPKTVSAMTAAPLEEVEGRAPYVLFSKLAPGTWIRPHTGFYNTRLVCHLPLIVPPKCSIRVGNETRSWEIGKALIFNDSINHEARNDSSETRVVLIFNIWRPELEASERRLIASLLESVDD